MGGKNHQPCRNFLGNSTRMSLALSAAFIAFEQVNLGLENHLLAELDGTGISYVSDIEQAFGDSRREIVNFRSAIAALLQQMRDENYQELPSVASMNLVHLGTQLREAGIATSERAWQDVSQMMKGPRGFYAILDTFDEKITSIDRLTTTLGEKMRSAIRSNTPLADLLEGNGDGNFKVDFAKLYSAWTYLQQLFLASSMLSTEAWYRFTEVGSLVDVEVGQRAAA